MAKLAVALCILLVACSGAQAGIFSSSADLIESAVNGFIEQVKNFFEAIGSYWENAKSTGASFIEDTTANIDTVLSEWQSEMEELRAEYGDISACINENNDIEARAQTVTETILDCASQAEDEYRADYESAYESGMELYSKLNATKDEAVKCAEGNMISAAMCMGNLLVQVTTSGELANQWLEVSANGAQLAGSLSIYGASLTGCGMTAGVSSWVTDASSSVAEIRTCLEELSADGSITA